MHAYLITGRDKAKTATEVDRLVKKIGARKMEFPIAKIGDVRTLQSFTKLAIDQPTAVVAEIGNASLEALNAFLKNLEEPQDNLHYILTSPDFNQMPATIISRCQIVKTGRDSVSANAQKNALDLLKASTGQKLAKLDMIRKREDAIAFLENFINGCHQLLMEGGQNSRDMAEILAAADKTRQRIKANGNVQLQLTNLIMRIS